MSYCSYFSKLVDVVSFAGPLGLSISKLFDALSPITSDEFTFIWNSLLVSPQYSSGFWYKYAPFDGNSSLHSSQWPSVDKTTLPKTFDDLFSPHTNVFDNPDTQATIQIGVHDSVFLSLLGLDSSSSHISPQRFTILVAIASGRGEGVLQSDLPRLCDIEHQGSKEANKTVFYHVKGLVDEGLVEKSPVYVTFKTGSVSTNKLVLKKFREADGVIGNKNEKKRFNLNDTVNNIKSYFSNIDNVCQSRDDSDKQISFYYLNKLKCAMFELGISRGIFQEAMNFLINSEFIYKIEIVDDRGTKRTGLVINDPDQIDSAIINEGQNQDQQRPSSQILSLSSHPFSFLPSNPVCSPGGYHNVPLYRQLLSFSIVGNRVKSMTGISAVDATQLLVYYPKLIIALGKELADLNLVRRMNIQHGKVTQQFFGPSKLGRSMNHLLPQFNHLFQDQPQDPHDDLISTPPPSPQIPNAPEPTRTRKLNKGRSVQSYQRQVKCLEIVDHHLAISSLLLQRELSTWQQQELANGTKVDKATVHKLVKELEELGKVKVVHDERKKDNNVDVIVSSKVLTGPDFLVDSDLLELPEVLSAIHNHHEAIKLSRSLSLSHSAQVSKKTLATYSVRTDEKGEKEEKGEGFEQELEVLFKRVELFHSLLASSLCTENSNDLSYSARFINQILTFSDLCKLIKLPNAFPSQQQLIEKHGESVFGLTLVNIPASLNVFLKKTLTPKISKLNSLMIKLNLIYFCLENKKYRFNSDYRLVSLIEESFIDQVKNDQTFVDFFSNIELVYSSKDNIMNSISNFWASFEVFSLFICFKSFDCGGSEFLSLITNPINWPIQELLKIDNDLTHLNYKCSFNDLLNAANDCKITPNQLLRHLVAVQVRQRSKSRLVGVRKLKKYGQKKSIKSSRVLNDFGLDDTTSVATPSQVENFFNLYSDLDFFLMYFTIIYRYPATTKFPLGKVRMGLVKSGLMRVVEKFNIKLDFSRLPGGLSQSSLFIRIDQLECNPHFGYSFLLLLSYYRHFNILPRISQPLSHTDTLSQFNVESFKSCLKAFHSILRPSLSFTTGDLLFGYQLATPCPPFGRHFESTHFLHPDLGLYSREVVAKFLNFRYVDSEWNSIRILELLFSFLCTKVSILLEQNSVHDQSKLQSVSDCYNDDSIITNLFKNLPSHVLESHMNYLQSVSIYPDHKTNTVYGLALAPFFSNEPMAVLFKVIEEKASLSKQIDFKLSESVFPSDLMFFVLYSSVSSNFGFKLGFIENQQEKSEGLSQFHLTLYPLNDYDSTPIFNSDLTFDMDNLSFVEQHPIRNVITLDLNQELEKRVESSLLLNLYKVGSMSMKQMKSYFEVFPPRVLAFCLFGLVSKKKIVISELVSQDCSLFSEPTPIVIQNKIYDDFSEIELLCDHDNTDTGNIYVELTETF
ncbi:hypothetical protein P9112_012144 [Eukaryota sp. TZLM1-RC]